ncbi:MAG TPA: aminotransferase class I/II-fold pyridoxal phosphate-dependent enzyme [Gemmatimonadetes bacterium]|nr:aminotransferase class I/II-fold pyridoxal phosphate-dependent enzyme [Gemmatimonadota bacterium]
MRMSDPSALTRGRLDRRAFLRSAGGTALLGAVGVKPALAADVPEGLPASGPQVFDFDEVYDRVGTDSTKWDGAIATYGQGIEVGMGIADMDFRTAPCITRALAERCEHQNWGYLRRPDKYFEAIADWNRRRYGLKIDPGTLQWTAGVHPAIIAGLRTFAPPGTKVLMTTPTYNGFYSDLRYTQTVAEDCEMRLVDGRYTVDFDEFEARAARANVFMLCNPQNPTGNCWSPEDLTRMGEICLRHKVIVFSDEIHCDFVMKGQTYTPFASLPDRDIVDNSITFKAASKTFSLAAIKVAWYFSTNPDLLQRIKTNSRADVTTLGLVANHAGMTEGEPWLDQCRAYIDGNHDLVESYVQDRIPLMKYKKAQGTYLAWLDVSQVVDKIHAKEIAAKESVSSVDPVSPELVVQRWLAENARVYLNPGSTFGTGGAGHMRMNIATSRRMLKHALDNIAAALD